MVIEVDDTLVLVMLKTLRTCANAVEMNSPASYMLAQELADLGKPMEAINLGELQAALDRVDVRYHGMMRRLDGLKAAPPRNGGIAFRLVQRGRIRIDGHTYVSPELATLDGRRVTIEIPGGVLTETLIAKCGDLSFEIRKHAGLVAVPINMTVSPEAIGDSQLGFPGEGKSFTQ